MTVLRNDKRLKALAWKKYKQARSLAWEEYGQHYDAQEEERAIREYMRARAHAVHFIRPATLGTRRVREYEQAMKQAEHE
jgi:hypothetical protein